MRLTITTAFYLMFVSNGVAQFEFYASYYPGSSSEILLGSTHDCNQVQKYSPVNDKSLTDVAITPNGKLYAIDGANLYELTGNHDYYTHLFPLKTNLGVECSWSTGLAALNDTFLIFSCLEDLYKISVLNGDVTFLGSMSNSCDGDFAFLNDTLYMAGGGKLIQMILSPTDDHIESVTSKGYLSNPPYWASSFYGLFSAFESCESNKKILYGLAGTKLYSINTETAVITPVCSYWGAEFGGAASTEDFALSSNVPAFEIPNVFTPNGDGINDTYYFIDFPYAQNTFYFVIYDRWGAPVFQTQNPYFVWDGTTTKSNFVSDGVYFYVLKLDNSCMGNSVKSGTINVFK